MSGIRDFVGKRNKGESRTELFQKLSKGKSKKEIRKLESEMLKPEHLPPYTGQGAGRHCDIDKLTLKIVFPDEESFKLWKQHFRVSTYIEQSTVNIDKLIAFLCALDKGTIKYDKKKKKIECENIKSVRTRYGDH